MQSAGSQADSARKSLKLRLDCQNIAPRWRRSGTLAQRARAANVGGADNKKWSIGMSASISRTAPSGERAARHRFFGACACCRLAASPLLPQGGSNKETLDKRAACGPEDLPNTSMRRDDPR